MQFTAKFFVIFLLSISMVFLATLDANAKPEPKFELKAYKLPKAKGIESFTRSPKQSKLTWEEGLSGKHNYIVQLTDKPVAIYDGSIKGYKATAPGYAQAYKNRKKTVLNTKSSQKRTPLKLDLKSAAVIQYREYLDGQQKKTLNRMTQKLGFQPEQLNNFQLALNGLVLKLTQEEAKQISYLDEVAFIEREKQYQIETDRGPTLIGAPGVWDGTATGTAGFGEGVIVGIIDSGINTDHPSFAATSGDGFTHTNPYGDGVYVGDCAGAFPELCNSKLIGVRSYTEITDLYASDTAVFGEPALPANGEDYDGHGSHVASTAAGNTLLNVPLVSSELDVNESDGIVTLGYEFPEISGVAPRANIISYHVCIAGTPDDTYGYCSGGPMLQSVEDAIADGVDVLNMSISGGGNPWSYSQAQAFLNAQEAGIFVAVSAGNSGPGAETSLKNAPWYTSVAAATHGRILSYSKEIRDFTGGDTTPPGIIAGSANTVGITAPIVYAGDYDNPNDAPEEDSAQCLEPFPADTFSGQIVLCDRGEIARVAKAENVAAGGAGGYVLANVQGGDSFLANDNYVVPGIHINADDGDAIKTWLASGTDHTATITSTVVEASEDQADQLASFSSRGPNVTVNDVMAPTVTAPGVNIYAAYADQNYGYDVTGPAPADYNFLGGTSMSSPHVAGAGALLKSVHPSWTPDNIRSALMMTATRAVLKEDGTTDATIFDMGAGRIQVDQAARAGLVMDETAANYQAANPAVGGDPKTLNIPSMGNTQCEAECGWSRTFTAARAGDWTVSTVTNNENIQFTVSPNQFSVNEGDTQAIQVTASAPSAGSGEQAVGWVTMTSTNPDIPDMTLPVFVTVFASNLPSMVALDIHRDAGSIVLEGIEALEITDLASQSYGMQKAVSTLNNLPQDSDNSSAFDDTTDGVSQLNINVPEDSPLLWADLIDSEAQDMDLFIGKDDNGDGVAEVSELLCASTTPTSDEECLIQDATAGSYWVLVQNWTASAEGATDAVTLRTAYVPSTDDGNLTVSGPVSVPRATPFDLRIGWNEQMEVGDVFIGAIDLFSDTVPENAASLGQTVVVLNRAEDDVSISLSNDTPQPGDRVTVSVDIVPNTTTEEIDYTIDLLVPTGLTIDTNSITASDGSSYTTTAVTGGEQINWIPTRFAYDPSLNTYTQTTSLTDTSCVVPDFGQGGGYLNLSEFGIPQIGFYGDEIITNLGIPFNFLGESYSTFQVSDNGLLSFSASSSFIHQKMPDVTSPNNLIAPFWRDTVLDEASGSGISIATAGTWSIIEFDMMRHYAYYNGSPEVDDVMDFQVLNDTTTGNIIISYANVTHNNGDALGGSVGWENSDGTNGSHLIYVGGLYDVGAGDTGSVTDIQDGLTVCYATVLPSDEPLTLTFEADVSGDIASQTLTGTVNTQVSTINSQPDTYDYSLAVQSNLSITGSTTFIIDEDTSLVGATLTYTDRDSVENTVTVSSSQATIANVAITQSEITFDLTPDANFNGSITYTATVTDSVNTQDSTSIDGTVTVNPVNDAPTVAPTSTGTSTVTLNANADDIDGDTLTYSWVQTGGPIVTITGASAGTATVGNANATSGTLSFEVTVSDGIETVTGSTSITVTEPPPPPSSGGGGGGSTGTWFLMLLAFATMMRRRLFLVK